MIWFEIKSNVLALAHWLKEQGEWDDVGFTELPNGEIVNDNPIERLLYYFEKPWKWDNEWQKFQQEKTKTFLN